MYHDDYDDCPGCGRYDHGFNMPDTRAKLTIDNCRCKPECICTAEERKEFNDGEPFEDCICAWNGCDCGHHKVTIRVRRVFDQTCDYCGGCDYRCVFDVALDGERVKTLPSEQAADAFVAKVFPSAEPPEPDLAWESERWLRRAEGWGC